METVAETIGGAGGVAAIRAWLGMRRRVEYLAGCDLSETDPAVVLAGLGKVDPLMVDQGTAVNLVAICQHLINHVQGLQAQVAAGVAQRCFEEDPAVCASDEYVTWTAAEISAGLAWAHRRSAALAQSGLELGEYPEVAAQVVAGGWIWTRPGS